ncbi:armadillo-type protein [Xylariaceae sp. FL0255]|nr:armadillo-type protein [Xylariaceae sp. FL0255]
MENDIPLPTTPAEVAKLLQELNTSNSPEKIQDLGNVFQRVQKGPHGWEIADGLLGNSDENIRFYGVLTFTVKLNTEKLEDDHALSVLQSLVTWLIKSIEIGSGLVIRKLCSALMTYFIHYSHTCPRFVNHILICLERTAYVHPQDIGDTSNMNHVIQSLDTSKLSTATFFATTLAEGAAQIDLNIDSYIRLHERFVVNGEDTAALMSNQLPDISFQMMSIDCLHAWLKYAQRAQKRPLIQALQALILPAIHYLVVDELYDKAAHLLTDMMENWPALFTKVHIDSFYMLFESDWARERYKRLIEGDFDFDEMQFGQLLRNFADVQLVELMDAEDARAQSFLPALTGLLTAQGHPAVEDKIFTTAIDFWQNYVENLVDTIYEQSGSVSNLPWNKSPLSQVMLAVTHSWKKIQYPSLDVYNTWDSEEKKEFGDARKEVTHFLQGLYTISGLPLIQLFADYVLQALSNSAWAELEAACLCLGSLADCVSDGDSYDEPLTSVFSSSLFGLLRQGHDVVPVRAHQQCLYLIERYSEYFARHTAHLPGALNLLFSALQYPNLALPSSKAIVSLCSSCQNLLTPETAAFLGQYETLRNNKEFDSLAEERVVGAIAGIVQAIPDEGDKLNAVQKLLSLINIDISQSLELVQQNMLISPDNPTMLRAFNLAQRPTAPLMASEVAVQLAIRALHCLCSMAKGLQAPVDLDSDGDPHRPGLNDSLVQVCNDIMLQLIRVKEIFSFNAEVVEVLCDIIRAGFSETDPGPFVFSIEAVTGFINSEWKNWTATVMHLASIFVASLSTAKSNPHVALALETLFRWVSENLYQLPEPQSDPEMTQRGIEFMQRILSKYPAVFVTKPPHMLEFLFGFAMKVLNGKEPLPKQAAIEFWSTFLVAKADDPNVQKILDEALIHFGPQLAQSLVQNIGGQAQRSQLDKLCEPLKKLLVCHVHASKWLEAALNDPSFPSEKVSAKDRASFLKKLISLRGGRGTNQEVRNFFSDCVGHKL